MQWFKSSPYAKPLILILALFLLVAGFLAVRRFFPQNETIVAPRTFNELTEEEKKKILDSLTAPASAPFLSAEEKKGILKNLSAPSDTSSGVSSPEEQKRILDSLTAPSQ